jgi:hypothetical protein
METDDKRTFTYTFSFEDGSTKSFTVTLDNKSLSYQPHTSNPPPEWARLEVKQCPNCPLSTDEVPYCPVAANLHEVTDFFKTFFSYEKAEVSISSTERTYVKHVSVQEALSSLFGIIMTTSGCPLLDQLRPLVNTHLPFATIRESLYRSVSMYLTAQFFRKRNNMDADFTLEGLSEIYSDISKINHSFCDRLGVAFKKDANVNAVIILNCFAEFATISIDSNLLDEMEAVFASYLD